LLDLVDRNDAVCQDARREGIEIDKAGIHEPHDIAKLASTLVYTAAAIDGGPQQAIAVPPSSLKRKCEGLNVSLSGRHLDRRSHCAPARLYSSLTCLPHGLRDPSPLRLEHLVILYGGRHGRSEQQDARG
jgi:hypothetical protein